jgi:Sec-independent protein translocase protein TatA
MAFVVADVADLLRVLKSEPEWRALVRNELLGNELLELPGVVRELAGSVHELRETVGELAKDSAQLRETVRDLAKDIGQLRQTVEDMARAADVRFNRLEGRTGSMAGELAELRWSTHFSGRFGGLVRRARLVVPADLALFEEADEEARLSPEEARGVRDLDLIVQGVRGRGAEREPVLLAIEVSILVERGDVDRAAARAATLRKAGYNAVPVVAGARMDATLRDEAVARGVEVLLRPEDIAPIAEEPAA